MRWRLRTDHESIFPDLDDWTERDLLCAILVQLRRVYHAQVDQPSAILEFERVKSAHAEAVAADPKRHGPRLVGLNPVPARQGEEVDPMRATIYCLTTNPYRAFLDLGTLKTRFVHPGRRDRTALTSRNPGRRAALTSRNPGRRAALTSRNPGWKPTARIFTFGSWRHHAARMRRGK